MVKEASQIQPTCFSSTHGPSEPRGGHNRACTHTPLPGGPFTLGISSTILCLSHQPLDKTAPGRALAGLQWGGSEEGSVPSGGRTLNVSRSPGVLTEFSQLHSPVFQQFFLLSSPPGLPPAPTKGFWPSRRADWCTCALLAHCPPRAILHPCRGVPGLLPG